MTAEPATPAMRTMSIFELLSAYHSSLESMRTWLDEAQIDEIDRIAIADAWQSEMAEFFREQGYCFSCNRQTARCTCST